MKNGHKKPSDWFGLPFHYALPFCHRYEYLPFFISKKIGYVDSMEIFQKHSGTIEAREKMNEKREEWQSNITTLESELTTLTEEIAIQSKYWTSRELEIKKGIRYYARYRC